MLYFVINAKMTKINTILDMSQYGKYYENNRDVV